MAKASTANQHVIKVRLKDLVTAQTAMADLGSRALTGKVSFKVGKALKKASSEVETYLESNMKLLKDLGAKPSKQGGLELDTKHPNYEKAWKKLDDHRLDALDTEVELTGVVTVTIDELLKAMPLPDVKCLKCDTAMEYSDEEKAEKSIEPYICAALDWLIKE